MNPVGRNLKRLRQRAGLTQDALAERLHVTRQAVSSWETGKNQPDIETLTALAESLDADVRELIYGPVPVARPYARYQRKYAVCCAVCAAVVLVTLVVWGLAEPRLDELAKKGYILWPMFTAGNAASLLIYGGLGCLAPALVSLWADIRVTSRTARRVLLAAAVLLLTLYLFYVTAWMLGGAVIAPGSVLRRLWYVLTRSALLRIGLCFLGGCGAFLALNR